MKPSLFVFDLDGTLLDSIDDVADSMNHVLRQHGFPVHPREAYFYFVGNGARLLTERALPETARTEETVRAMQSDFMAYYAVHKADRTRPFEGLTPTLETLQSRGVRLAVASNKPHEVMDDLMRHYFPTIRFSVVFGHRPGHPIKPDPEIVRDILALCPVPKEDVRYVGDTAVDMETARRAGVRSVGVLWGFRPKAELVEAGADLLIAKPEELLSVP
ncbi:MAG: HAD family hydrolase [Bacteroidales bacterium]|nr:HAD family hydrolase [Bacteroidales bacterium]